MFSIIRRVRDLDIYGSTVGLTYKGERDFRTLCGGVVTLFSVLVLVAAGATEFYEVLFDKQYQQLTSAQFTPYASNEHQPYNVTTQ